MNMYTKANESSRKLGIGRWAVVLSTLVAVIAIFVGLGTAFAAPDPPKEKDKQGKAAPEAKGQASAEVKKAPNSKTSEQASVAGGIDKTTGQPMMNVSGLFYELTLRLEAGMAVIEWNTNDPGFYGWVYLYESPEKLDAEIIRVGSNSTDLRGKKKRWKSTVPLTPGMQARALVYATYNRPDGKGKWISIRRTEPFPDVAASSPK